MVVNHPQYRPYVVETIQELTRAIINNNVKSPKKDKCISFRDKLVDQSALLNIYLNI